MQTKKNSFFFFGANIGRLWFAIGCHVIDRLLRLRGRGSYSDSRLWEHMNLTQ